MEAHGRKNLIISTVAIAFIGILLTISLFLFYGKSDYIMGEVGISVLMSAGLIILCFDSKEKLMKHPLFSWFLITGYIIVAVMLCFPNDVLKDYGLYFIAVIPVAAFSGIFFSGMLLLGVLLLVMLTGTSPDLIYIIFAAFALLNSFMAAIQKEKLKFGVRIAILSGVQLITALILYFLWPDKTAVLRLLTVILAYTLIFAASFYFKNYNTLLWDAFDYREAATISETLETAATTESKALNPAEPALANINIQNHKLNIKNANVIVTITEEDIFSHIYTLSELCSKECSFLHFVARKMPKTIIASTKTALFGKQVAMELGCDYELVYCVLQYRDIIKSKNDDLSVEDFINNLPFPDNLKTLLLKVSDKDFTPSNQEEIIIYVSLQMVATNSYFLKQNISLGAEKLADTACTLMLKKGVIRDCGLSMSYYHKMRQSFKDNFQKYE